MNLKLIYPLFLIIPLIFACNDLKKEYQASLKKTKMNGSEFSISIPQDYILEKVEGPDFDNYYFYPADTTDLNSFYGGIYVGFAPSRFSKRAGEGKIKEINSKLLNKNAEWTIYEYDDEYFIQAIIEYTTDDNWDLMIHAFGSADSEENMEKLLWIFETLTEE